MPAPTTADIEDLLLRLEAGPGQYAALLRGRDEDTLSASPAPGEWNPREILAHVRAGDDLLTGRIYMMMARDNPPFVEIDERRWSDIAGYVEYPLDLLLDSFALRRAELVRMLRRIDRNDWKRTAEHHKRGRMTVFTIASHISDHEQEHLAQLEAALGVVREAATA